MALEWEQVVIHAVDAAALGRWWADALDWVVLADPEGNEFCVLGPRTAVASPTAG